jgi:hypothetical protein
MATICTFSLAGAKYSWASTQVIILLLASLILWSIFFWVETKTVEPILAPEIFRNPYFVLIMAAAFLSFFGQLALMTYYPLFLQAVQGIGALQAGQAIAPCSVLILLFGVPAGFLLGKLKRFKWAYVSAYIILTAVMFGLVLFRPETSMAWNFTASTLAGLGFGAIAIINILALQVAVPRRLGAAMGALFFVSSMGAAIAPAILGSTMNTSYEKSIKTLLPDTLLQAGDGETIGSLANSRILLSADRMTALSRAFNKRGSEGKVLFEQTVRAIRVSTAKGLRSVFLVGAIAIIAAFLSIIAIPKTAIDPIGQEGENLDGAKVDIRNRSLIK